ncbi:SDR family oxidoreductase [Pedobacter steynii]|uniref:Short-chain dehydrogenase n=1 Tax=Pedobacter steynii TaxID=430522 RepID=A0A1D7QPF6_9SPHI|nr:SDR family NAD(P)-dependent oxidoreductase [Pedobacter steynii]AOM80566.1 short-chain dehydrogenase [Pedobacter steynii]
MDITNNTILITGGSAGIGFEIAKAFTAAGNKVIITGRDQQRLDEALLQLPGATGFKGDISSEADTEALVAVLLKDFPTLNIVVNNAGQAYKYNIAEPSNAFEKAQDEMLTNYLAVVRLNEKLLPQLKAQSSAAIVNVTSIVALVPGQLTTYSASKAALHSYSQSLRIALERSSGQVKVFELMPPLVNTSFSAIINGHNGIPAAEVATDLITALEKDEYEIHVGNTRYIYELSLSSPEEALTLMNPVA